MSAICPDDAEMELFFFDKLKRYTLLGTLQCNTYKYQQNNNQCRISNYIISDFCIEGNYVQLKLQTITGQLHGHFCITKSVFDEYLILLQDTIELHKHDLSIVFYGTFIFENNNLVHVCDIMIFQQMPCSIKQLQALNLNRLLAGSYNVINSYTDSISTVHGNTGHQSIVNVFRFSVWVRRKLETLGHTVRVTDSLSVNHIGLLIQDTPKHVDSLISSSLMTEGKNLFIVPLHALTTWRNRLDNNCICVNTTADYENMYSQVQLLETVNIVVTDRFLSNLYHKAIVVRMRAEVISKYCDIHPVYKSKQFLQWLYASSPPKNIYGMANELRSLYGINIPLPLDSIQWNMITVSHVNNILHPRGNRNYLKLFSIIGGLPTKGRIGLFTYLPNNFARDGNMFGASLRNVLDFCFAARFTSKQGSPLLTWRDRTIITLLQLSIFRPLNKYFTYTIGMPTCKINEICIGSLPQQEQVLLDSLRVILDDTDTSMVLLKPSYLTYLDNFKKFPIFNVASYNKLLRDYSENIVIIKQNAYIEHKRLVSSLMFINEVFAQLKHFNLHNECVSPIFKKPFFEKLKQLFDHVVSNGITANIDTATLQQLYVQRDILLSNDTSSTSDKLPQECIFHISSLLDSQIAACNDLSCNVVTNYQWAKREQNMIKLGMENVKSVNSICVLCNTRTASIIVGCGHYYCQMCVIQNNINNYCMDCKSLPHIDQVGLCSCKIVPCDTPVFADHTYDDTMLTGHIKQFLYQHMQSSVCILTQSHEIACKVSNLLKEFDSVKLRVKSLRNCSWNKHKVLIASYNQLSNMDGIDLNFINTILCLFNVTSQLQPTMFSNNLIKVLYLFKNATYHHMYTDSVIQCAKSVIELSTHSATDSAPIALSSTALASPLSSTALASPLSSTALASPLSSTALASPLSSDLASAI